MSDFDLLLLKNWKSKVITSNAKLDDQVIKFEKLKQAFDKYKKLPIGDRFPKRKVLHFDASARSQYSNDLAITEVFNNVNVYLRSLGKFINLLELFGLITR